MSQELRQWYSATGGKVPGYLLLAGAENSEIAAGADRM